MKKLVKQWWVGTFVPYKNDPQSMLVFVGGDVERHWTSHLCHKIWDFLKVEWKWAVATTIAVVGLTMTYIRFF